MRTTGSSSHETISNQSVDRIDHRHGRRHSDQSASEHAVVVGGIAVGSEHLANQLDAERHFHHHGHHSENGDQMLFSHKEQNIVALATQHNYHNNMKKITLVTALLAVMSSCSSTASSGWGHNQGRDTVKGGLLGAVTGGVIGHQSGKQKEGILIGTVLGGLVGNKIGQGRDRQIANQSRDHELENARARAARLEAELARARELQQLREREARARQELQDINK